MVVETIPAPVAGPGDALVAVHAAAITPSELGWEPTWTHPDGSARVPVIPSHEMAGVVVALGADVAEPRVGTRVFGLTDFYRDGAAADLVAVRAADLAEMPARLDAVEVAALPLSGLTAWQALFDHGHLLAGQRVLVHGASGGVGSFAVQLAHHAGAHVSAVASGGDAAMVRDLGAEIVIERAPGPFPVEPGSFDLVLDTVGGDVLDRSWPVLAGDGRLVSIAPSSGDIAARDPRGHFFVVSPDRGELAELVRLLGRGDLRVVIERTFPLDQAREAYEFGQREHPRGKVVLRVRG
jgi:NADPH:quinone reductase-like Zn-dependent oxidoreductase